MGKRYLSLSVVVLVLLFFGVVIFSAPTVSAKTVTLRLVVPTPAGDWPLTYKDLELAKRFNERAQGEYEIKVFTGGALVKMPEYFDAVRTGAIEMADIAWSFFSFLDPRLGLIETPFLINNIEASIAASKEFLPLYDAILQEKFNAKGLGLMNLSGVELVSRKPVKTMADWKGLMVGALSPLTAQMIKGLGGSPAVIPFMDMYTSLQKGVIDATTSVTHATLALGYMEVCTDVSLFYGIASWNGYSINLNAWNKMPKHIQQILQEEVDKTVEWMHKTQLQLEDDDVQAYKKLGKNIHVIPKAERERWVQALTPFKNEQISKFGEFGKKIVTIVDEVNAKYPYKDRVIR
jgi:TRAP-type C4-dicarboxylate transport system substrate-binding protein